MRKNKPTRCGKCGGTAKPFTMFANASTGESYSLCINCMSSRTANYVDDLGELDELISQHEEMITGLESIIKERGKMEISPEIEEFGFTPMSTYKMAQLTLASLKAKRLELLSNDKNEGRLQYELDKKIDEENYEEARAIQKELDELKTNPKKKRRGFVKKEKKSFSLFASNEAAEGRCIRCKRNFPKPPGLFYNKEIGDCHDMCISCCIHEIPRHVNSIKMAEEMIEDMEKYMNMMDKMSLLGNMMREESGETDLQGKDEHSKSPVQRANDAMLDVLKRRKNLLEKTNENKDIIGVANMLDGMVKKVYGENAIADTSNLIDKFAREKDRDEKRKNDAKIARKKSAEKKTEKQKKEDSKKSLDKAVAWISDETKGEKKCIKCNKYPIKIPVIFEDHNIGKCENMCWTCGTAQIALEVKTIKTATEMIEEMDGISKALDKIVALGKMYEAKETNKDKDEKVDENKDEVVEVQLAQQMIARKIIDVLEHRLSFLEGVGEKSALVPAADLFVKMMRKQTGDENENSNHMSKLFDAIGKILDEEE